MVPGAPADGQSVRVWRGPASPVYVMNDVVETELVQGEGGRGGGGAVLGPQCDLTDLTKQAGVLGPHPNHPHQPSPDVLYEPPSDGLLLLLLHEVTGHWER